MMMLLLPSNTALALLFLSISMVRAAEQQQQPQKIMSLVANRRYAEPSDSSNCSFAGSVVLGGPSSIEPDDKFFYLARKMHSSMVLTVDFINKYQCGIQLSSGQNYAIEMITYGDDTSKETTSLIGEKLVSDPEVDIILGGYSSGLTEPLSKITNESHHLLLAPGSASTSVFQGRDFSFGTMPPSANYPSQGMAAVAQAGAKTVATIYEDVGFTSGVCAGIPGLADIHGMTVTSTNQVPANPNITTLQPVAAKLSQEDPDVVVSCVYDTGCVNWMKAMRASGWSPKAQMFTICVGLHHITKELGTDAEYVMGVTPWDASLNISDAVTNLTPQEFAIYYEAYTSDTDVTYHAASGAAVISILKQAIERADSFKDTQALRDIIATQSFTTVYGEARFDVNGQSQAPTLLIQYDLNRTVQTVYPYESSSGPLLYPMPSWIQRDCIHLSGCIESGGTCITGECVCNDLELYESTGLGETAVCTLVENNQGKVVFITETANLGLVIGLPVACTLAVGVILFLIYDYKRKQNDSVWMVKKEELKFSSPPEIIGRGSFGVVLLAEYRGTQVAVKRVIPPEMPKQGNSILPHRTSSDSTTEDDRCDWLERGCNNPSSTGNKSKESHQSFAASSSTSTSDKKSSNAGVSSWAVMSVGLSKTATGAILQSMNLNNKKSTSKKSSKSSPSSSDRQARKKMKQEFLEEMRYLSKLRHPCITTVMGAVTGRNIEPMLVLEYMDHGSLYDLLQNETMVLEGEVLLPILRDITQGVRFLHSANPQVIHGDLKAQNILVDTRFRAKVADFGLAHKKNLGGTGTPFWMAPELLRGESSNTAGSDVFSFGIILFEVYSRRYPYEGEDAMEVLQLVADKNIQKRPPFPANMPAAVQSLMKDSIQDDPEKRPTFEELDIRLKRADSKDVDAGQGTKTRRSSVISLFDIFPRHIAEALRDGRTIEPEHKESVTIFFSDIIGFTEMSAKLPPQKVADMLDRLYTKFDALSQKHDVYKTETIGDSWMGVTNLVKDQKDDHCKRIALFAIDAVAAANGTYIDLDDHEMGFVDIRVGFHSGPVVADVVGTRNPRYCLFGDTVNTASRMESNSKKNRIHCSINSADLLIAQYPDISLVSRGTIPIKGKEEMHTFWVNEQVGGGGCSMRSHRTPMMSSYLGEREEYRHN